MPMYVMRRLSGIANKIRGTFVRIATRLFSSDPAETMAVSLLLKVYNARYKNAWTYGKEVPHFFNQRIGIARFAFGDQRLGAYVFSRGFLASQVIQEGDQLLDIGCGDGFFTRRFFTGKCRHIDAIDIEPSAIMAANKYNGDNCIRYQVMDATKEPFPNNRYDVIVWDGAIGHFPSETIHVMLKKITGCLSEKGVFVGSESLGDEGSDHLTRFETLDDFGKLLRNHFAVVQLHSDEYRLDENHFRHEAYWRCSNSSERITGSNWADFE
jgi:SAM-dependent methyltransferase